MNEIYRKFVNPEILDILGIKECELLKQPFNFKPSLSFKRKTKIFIIRFEDTFVKLEYCAPDIYIPFSVITLNNCHTLEGLKTFRKLMDSYFDNQEIIETL